MDLDKQTKTELILIIEAQGLRLETAQEDERCLNDRLLTARARLRELRAALRQAEGMIHSIVDGWWPDR